MQGKGGSTPGTNPGAETRTHDRPPASLTAAGYGDITTEIKPLDTFYYAEDYHQQYLDKNPGGYCNMHGTGISCSITGTTGLGVSAH